MALFWRITQKLPIHLFTRLSEHRRYQPGSYGFHNGDAFLLVQNLLICTTNFQYVIKIEIIGAALQQAPIISKNFGAALQQLHHR